MCLSRCVFLFKRDDSSVCVCVFVSEPSRASLAASRVVVVFVFHLHIAGERERSTTTTTNVDYGDSPLSTQHCTILIYALNQPKEAENFKFYVDVIIIIIDILPLLSYFNTTTISIEKQHQDAYTSEMLF